MSAAILGPRGCRDSIVEQSRVKSARSSRVVAVLLPLTEFRRYDAALSLSSIERTHTLAPSVQAPQWDYLHAFLARTCFASQELFVVSIRATRARGKYFIVKALLARFFGKAMPRGRIGSR